MVQFDFIVKLHSAMGKATRSQTNNGSEVRSLSELNTEEFSVFIANIIDEKTRLLVEEMQALKREVVVLRESNIDLIRLLVEKKCDCGSAHATETLNNSIDSTSSDTTVISNIENEVTKEIREKTADKLPTTRKKRNNKTINTNSGQKHHTSTDKKFFLGQGVDDVIEKSEFKAAKRRLWLHVSRVAPGIKVDKINDYLQRKCRGHQFVVEQITGDAEHNGSFKIGADYDLQDVLYSDKFWPAGVAVRRFNFFRRPSNRKQFE